MSQFKKMYASNVDIFRLGSELNVFFSVHEQEEKGGHDFSYYMKLNKLDIVFSEV